MRHGEIPFFLSAIQCEEDRESADHEKKLHPILAGIGETNERKTLGRGYSAMDGKDAQYGEAS